MTSCQQMKKKKKLLTNEQMDMMKKLAIANNFSIKNVSQVYFGDFKMKVKKSENLSVDTIN